jgi:hypothetical protein
MAAMAVSAGVVLATWAAEVPWSPAAFLRGEASATSSDLAALDRGATFVKVIDTSDKSEIFSVAAVRLRASRTAVIAALLDVDGAAREPWILQAARLSPAPAPADFAGLTLDAGDVRHLSKCRVTDCDVRLPSDAIERLRAIDWRASDAPAAANAAFRGLLRDYATAYLERGDAALFEYANNDQRVRIADSLQVLLQRMRFLYELAPDLDSRWPRASDGRSPGARDVLYWQNERFWVLNVLSLNHRIVVEASGGRVLAVTKQLYANHYYESSLSAVVFTEGPGSTSSLILVNRTRADIRRSGFNWFERTLLRALVRGRLEGQLKHWKRRLRSG